MCARTKGVLLDLGVHQTFVAADKVLWQRKNIADEVRCETDLTTSWIILSLMGQYFV